jgi:hypothetical protein
MAGSSAATVGKEGLLPVAFVALPSASLLMQSLLFDQYRLPTCYYEYSI